MEQGRRSKRRKFRERGNVHAEQPQGKKKQKKTKTKKEKVEEEEEETDENATLSSSRDEAALKLQRKKKKRKSSEEEREECCNGVTACAEPVCETKKKAKNVTPFLCKLKEHNQLQEGGSHHAHIDHIAFLDQTKQVRKKVRFSDQLATCKCRQSLSEESLADNFAEEAKFTVSCSCNKDNIKEEPSQGDSMNSYAGQVRKAIDEKSLSTRKTQKDEDDEVWGKRFTPEEDELLKKAVLDYIKVKGWEEKEGIDKVLNCKRHKEARNCWGVIRLCLPHRPRRSVRLRSFYLLEEGTHLGRWSKEEEELLKRLHKEHGNQWKYLSTLIGRSQYSIGGKWRILKRPSPRGVWAWDEMQQLSDLVHKNLGLKALSGLQNEKFSHKRLRDNVSWDEIADAMGTHSHASCCTKWYRNLSSPMVMDGLWATEDDCLLLESLLETGACTEEEVEWHKLLSHRSGQTCLVRWKQMVKYLGENRTRAFLEKLDSLVRRYAPELLTHKG